MDRRDGLDLSCRGGGICGICYDMARYSVVLEWDEEERVYGASVPALPGCISVGKTEEEATQNITEAIELHVEGLKEDGLPVPVEERPAMKILTVEVKEAA